MAYLDYTGLQRYHNTLLDTSLSSDKKAAPADLVGELGCSVLPYTDMSWAEKTVSEASRTITVNGNLVKQTYDAASSTYRAFAVIKNGAIKYASAIDGVLSAMDDSDLLTLPATNGRLRMLIFIKAKTTDNSTQNLPVVRLIYKSSGSLTSYAIEFPSGKVSSFNGAYIVDLPSLITDDKYAVAVVSRHSKMEFTMSVNIVIDDPQVSGAIASDGDAW